MSAPRRADLLALALVVAAALAWGFGLERFPTASDDEAMIAAPGIGLFEHGRYGTELFAGWRGAGEAWAVMPPLQPVLAGLSTRLFGVGLWQVRLVSWALGLLALVAAWALARSLLGPWPALAAVAFLSLAVLSPPGLVTIGPPLADLARRGRYDVPLAALVPLGLLCLARAPGGPLTGALLGGACAGLALQAHPQGAALLPALLAWVASDGRPRRAARAGLLAAGMLFALLPWLAFLARHQAELRAQAAVHTRIAEVAGGGTLRSALQEPRRYAPVATALRRHPGAWVWLGALLAGAWSARRTPPGRALLALVGTLVALQALFLRPWSFLYLAPLWGPLALLAGQGAAALAARSPRWRAAVAVAGLALAADGVLAYARAAERGRRSSYAALEAGLAQRVPAGSRMLGRPAYWLGLRDHVGAYLALVALERSDQDPSGGAFARTAEAWRPDAFLADPDIRIFLRVSQSPSHPFHARGERLRGYLAEHFRPTDVYDDPGYGRFEVWLRREAPAPPPLPIDIR